MDSKEKLIDINIWDDYYEDGFIPEGKFQETYIYIEEEDFSDEDNKECLSIILKYIETKLDLKNVDIFLYYYDSRTLYPENIEKMHESLILKRWEIRLKHLTHKRKEQLMGELNRAGLFFKNSFLNFYSES
jgi:hypothetical protein